ncbi:MAG: pH regulation protein F [Alphaproteobacteria bacterium]|nr:pH regulation protein F [Alphaproteobacteria bacterium]MBF0250587.1 pH regulation protein F [Alphaproteobacteria bacterium]
MTLFSAAAVGILATLALVMVRAVAGPTVFDRILAVNAAGTLTVGLIAVYGFLDGRPDFLDIALLYALINFIGTIAVTKYVKFRDLGHPARSPQAEEGDV